MAIAFETPRAETGILLLADISGFTSFLEAVAVAHPEMLRSGGEAPPAYRVLSSLLDVVVARIEPAFTLANVEGDAVFAYGLGDGMAGNAEGVLDTVRAAYGAFRERVAEAMVIHRHDCQACLLLPSLELKFLVHHGPYVIQPIAGRQTLLGPAVNVAHRLLKNSVTDRTGRRAYLLVTDAAVEHLAMARDIGSAHEEDYADVGSIAGIVIGLDAVVTRGAGEAAPTSSVD